MASGGLGETDVIPRASPVPSFGAPESQVATLGLNPSHREFVDNSGNPLLGNARRLHTLDSLGLTSWSQAEDCHIQRIWDDCRSYFSKNPYNRWFKPLDGVISDAGFSYYADSLKSACHLDLVPYATCRKWTELEKGQQSKLLNTSADTLGHLLRDSSVRVLILNGRVRQKSIPVHCPFYPERNPFASLEIQGLQRQYRHPFRCPAWTRN